MSRNGTRRNIDWLTIIIYLVLILLGWMTIYAAHYSAESTSIFDTSQEYGKQFIWIGICLFVALIVMNIDGNMFSQFAWPIYGVVIVMLILVLIIGKEVNGAKAWFGVGSFAIQPSEFSKMATSLVLARFITAAEVQFRSFRTRMLVALIILLPAGLILLQPDVGTLLVFTAFIFPMYREGLSGNILIFGLGALVIGVVSILMTFTTLNYWFVGEASGIYLLGIVLLIICGLAMLVNKGFTLPRYRRRNYILIALIGVFSLGFMASISWVMTSEAVLKDYQKERIQIMLGLLEDPQGRGYNLDKSKMAIGSGGWTGKGYLQGPLTNYNYVPEQSTDFVYTVIGEEWGFIGSVIVIALFLFLILRIIFIAERQRSRFTRIYGYSVASILFLHITINIGMVMGLAPVIGIPLPFFSYGGSSLLGFTLLLFIFLRLDAERMSVFR